MKNPHRSLINIFTENIEYRVRNINKIKDCLFDIIKSERKELGEVNIILTDNETMLSINQQYLNHDTYTDTITFPYSDIDDEAFGDVYICLDMVKDNARTYKCRIQEELFRIMVHGTLHLCGYEDKKDESDKDIMFAKQEEYIKKHLSSIL